MRKKHATELGVAVQIIRDVAGCCGCTEAQEEALAQLLGFAQAPDYRAERTCGGLVEILYEMLNRAGLVTHGSTVHYSWLTELGRRVLAELLFPTPCADCGHRAVDHQVDADAPPTLWDCLECRACQGFTSMRPDAAVVH